MCVFLVKCFPLSQECVSVCLYLCVSFTPPFVCIFAFIICVWKPTLSFDVFLDKCFPLSPECVSVCLYLCVSFTPPFVCIFAIVVCVESCPVLCCVPRQIFPPPCQNVTKCVCIYVWCVCFFVFLWGITPPECVRVCVRLFFVCLSLSCFGPAVSVCLSFANLPLHMYCVEIELFRYLHVFIF